MKVSPLPENEKERLEELRSYQILDSEPEQDFDDIVELASQLCDSPIALITLIDESRQWLKAKIGIDISETTRGMAFCAHAIHDNDIMIIRNATQDDRFHDNPLVTGDPHIRFYAGMPLITSKGFKLGTLCVIDQKPKDLSELQLKALRILGKQVVNLLELRIRNLELKNQVLEKTTEIKDAFARDIIERKHNEESLREAEVRYRTIFDNALDGIYQSTREGKFMLANPALAKIFGYASSEELVNTVSDIGSQLYADPQDRLNLKNLLARDGKALGYEFRVFKKNKEIIWVRVNVRAVYDEVGNITYLEGTLRETTERKKAEAQIIKEKDLAISIINSLPGVFYLFNSAGKYLRWNRNLETITGYTGEEIANMHPSEFFEEGEERDMLVARIAEVFTKGFAQVETNLFLKDKRKIPYYFNGWKIEYENQTCLIGVGIDIAERKKAEDELRESEIYLRGILDSTTDGILAIDTNGKVISSNNRFKELWHIPEELMALKDDHALLTYVLGQLVDPEEFLRKVEDLYRSDRTDFDILQFKDGRIFERHYNPLVLNKNRVGKVWSFRDATDRKKAEEKLRNSENKLRAFFRSMPDASVLLGRNFEILAFSDAGYDLNASTYGTELHEGDIFIDKIFPEVRPLIIEFVLKALNGEISKGEFPIPNIKTGHSVWWLAVFMPAYDSDGNIFGVVANSTNINDIKRAELKLKKQFEELQKTNHELDHFVYSVSHDLRAPLASILGLITVAEMERPAATFKNYLAMMRSSINRLDGFIKDILDYSRNSRMDVQPESINFHKLIGEIQNNFKLINGAERLKIDVVIEDTVTFYSDRRRIEILLNNLLSNSIKYQDFQKGSAFVFIHIVTSADKASIKFSDNGIGIEEKHLDKIFDMFYRASEDSKGSGIGLYIAKETIAKLGGTIKVESEFGLSTTFEITIPNSIPNK